HFWLTGRERVRRHSGRGRSLPDPDERAGCGRNRDRGRADLRRVGGRPTRVRGPRHGARRVAARTPAARRRANRVCGADDRRWPAVRRGGGDQGTSRHRDSVLFRPAGRWCVKRRRTLAATVILILAIAGLAVRLDPDRRALGWVRAEPFYHGRAASAWRRDL